MRKSDLVRCPTCGDSWHLRDTIGGATPVPKRRDITGCQPCQKILIFTGVGGEVRKATPQEEQDITSKRCDLLPSLKWAHTPKRRGAAKVPHASTTPPT